MVAALLTGSSPRTAAATEARSAQLANRRDRLSRPDEHWRYPAKLGPSPFRIRLRSHPVGVPVSTTQMCRRRVMVPTVSFVLHPRLPQGSADALRPSCPGNGPSSPSGQVMAAVAIWGLLPPVVALLTCRRSAWWWSVALPVVSSSQSGSAACTWECIGSLTSSARSCSARRGGGSWRHHRRRGCAAIDVGEGLALPHPFHLAASASDAPPERSA